MFLRGTAIALLVVFIPSLAVAATPGAPASPPVGSEPQQTSATFGDWILRCTRLSATAADSQTCEVAEVLRVQGQQAPIAQVAIGRPLAERSAAERSRASGLRLTVLLPVNMSFDKAPRLAMDQNDPQPIVLTWRRCVPGGCFADAAVSETVLKKLRARTEPMRITFTDASGRELALPLSPRGLSPALDALAKEGSGN